MSEQTLAVTVDVTTAVIQWREQMRQKKKRTRLWIAATAGLFVLGVALTAEARGPHGGGGPGFGGRGPGAGSLIGRILFPCPAACDDTAHSCMMTADSAAVTCVEGACAAEITAAQTACADDRRSDECRAGVSTLRECGADCLDTRSTAASACRDALDTCLEACDAG